MTRMVRSLWGASRVPGAEAPYDTAHLRVFYPALREDTQDERMTGVMRPDPAGAPFPVAVILPGVNVGQDAYRWLAIRLAEAGIAAVTYDLVGALTPGLVGVSPGLDLAAVTPDAYGARPTAPGIHAVLDGVAALAAEGALAGALDLDRIALIGHSAGGTAVLQSAATRWYPGLRAAVVYGAHTQPAQVLGYDAGAILASPVDVPLLLMHGTEDGIMAASAVRYGQESGARVDPVERTYDEATAACPDAWLLTFKGANHFAIGHPHDTTSARGFLDGEPTTDPAATRECLAAVVTDFLTAHLLPGDEAAHAAERLADLPTAPPTEIATVRRRTV
jgi:dienelactone hydrolase